MELGIEIERVEFHERHYAVTAVLFNEEELEGKVTIYLEELPQDGDLKQQLIETVRENLTSEKKSERLFRHWKNGDTYRLVCVANQEADGAIQVVYQQVPDGYYYTRPYAEFFGMAPDHSGKARFEELPRE